MKRVAVLVKQVPDPEALVRVAGERELSVEPKLVTSFFDEVAIEQAVRLKERFGCEVTAITAGTGKATDALRRALAMGVDRAIQIDDPAIDGADGLGVATAIAALLRTLEPDLILCGRVSGDTEAGLVGPAVAAKLGCPHVMAVVGLEPDAASRRAVVRRQVERGVESLDVPLPSVLGAQKGLCEPRVPKVMGVMKAAKAPIDRRTLASLGLDAGAVAPRVALMRYEAPPARGPVRMIEGDQQAGVEQLARLLRDLAGAAR